MEEILILGIILIFVGMLLVMVGILSESRSVEGGGVVMIGPIPIIFGSNKNMALLAGVAVLLILLYLILVRVL